MDAFNAVHTTRAALLTARRALSALHTAVSDNARAIKRAAYNAEAAAAANAGGRVLWASPGSFLAAPPGAGAGGGAAGGAAGGGGVAPYSAAAVKRAAHLRAHAEISRANEAAAAALRTLDGTAAAEGGVRGEGDRLRAGGAKIASLERSQANLRAGLLSVHLLSAVGLGARRERELTPDEATAARRGALRLVDDALRLARARASAHAKADKAAVAAAVCQDVGVGGTLVWPAPDVQGWMRRPVIARVLRLFSLGEHTRYLASRAARDGITVIVAGEAFTTKTCARCQCLCLAVQGRWFVCPHCGFETLRDGNGASNMAPFAIPCGAQVLAEQPDVHAALAQWLPPRALTIVRDIIIAVTPPAGIGTTM